MKKPSKVEPYHGHLHDYETGAELRLATKAEAAMARRAREDPIAKGAFKVDGVLVYVRRSHAVGAKRAKAAGKQKASLHDYKTGAFIRHATAPRCAQGRPPRSGRRTPAPSRSRAARSTSSADQADVLRRDLVGHHALQQRPPVHAEQLGGPVDRPRLRQRSRDQLTLVGSQLGGFAGDRVHPRIILNTGTVSTAAGTGFLPALRVRI